MVTPSINSTPSERIRKSSTSYFHGTLEIVERVGSLNIEMNSQTPNQHFGGGEKAGESKTSNYFGLMIYKS